MELKTYQRATLDTLRRFFEDARVVGPQAAFDTIVAKAAAAAGTTAAARAGRYRPLDGLGDVPYVCLQLPTGGGKTILGAHAVRTVADAWAEKDYPVVLWLVPGNTIRRQTVEALKNPRHPYRRALDDGFGGRVRVFDIADFNSIPAHDFGANLCVAVGTIQTLRVGNTEGRRVYAHHEDLESHFRAVPAGTPGLEQLPGGGAKFSFANLLHVHRPIMIVDEAHNAVTGLTREMQQRINPCAIVEFTATPRGASNILHRVPAQALKVEEMIKLPIVLAEHRAWETAVTDAVARRAELARAARGEADYIRPITLFQAQPKNGEVTVEVLLRHLIDVQGIDKGKIAVVTGDQRELDGLDLFLPSCPIEHVITVEALKEGWDCSFAYVFCSVANIRSAIDVEQLLGRVLRMPYARRRRDPVLNRAYAYVTAAAFQEAVDALCGRLVKMGFEEAEAEDSIEAQRHMEELDDGLFAQRPLLSFGHTVAADPATLDALRAVAAAHGVRVAADGDGAATLAVTGALSAAAEAAIAAVLPEARRAGFREAAARYRAEVRSALPLADRGERFIVPSLVAWVQGELMLADSDRFMETVDWSIRDYPARLEAGEFTVGETADSFEIDLNGAMLSVRLATEQEQLPLDLEVDDWSEEGLVLWLNGRVRQWFTDQGELVAWLGAVVRDLIVTHRIPLAALMRTRFVLGRTLRDRIVGFHQDARAKLYQRCLFDPGAKTAVSFDDAFAFEFKAGMFDDQRFYKGRQRFNRHFLGPDKVPAFDGISGGEEERCAVMIDSAEGVDFWVRNVRQHKNAFRLPTATGFFYPDFVARLTDGRTMIIEYKGAHLEGSDDTTEKRAVGLLWEQAAAGAGLFLMVEKQVDGRDPREQIRRKIALSS